MMIVRGVHKLSDILDKIAEIIIVAMLGAMVIITGAQIVCRIFFTALAWSQEATRYLLIWSTLFSHLAVARNTWMVCENLQRYSEIFPIWGVVTNFLLNYLLIPRLGAMGASVATLATQVVVTFFAPLFYKEVRPSVKHMTEAFFARDLRDRLKGAIGKKG